MFLEGTAPRRVGTLYLVQLYNTSEESPARDSCTVKENAIFWSNEAGLAYCWCITSDGELWRFP